jgi:Domain of unknown function (DUF4329)
MRLVLAVCIAFSTTSAATAQSEPEAALVQAMFRVMNAQSIAYDREVCGHILRNPAGRLEVSKVSWGGPASCAMTPTPAGYQVVSSWHTHAAWAQGYDNEVPSLIDVEGDLSQGINGWLATPGGRLWYINGQTGEIHQYCGAECLPSDPNSQMDARGPVDKHYTLSELRARFASR